MKVTVDICCLTEYHTLLAVKGLSGHGIYYYVPGLLKEFTASDINALIVPRAHLGLAGTKDALTPVAGLDIIDRELKAAYAEAGHPERWKLLRYDVGAPGDGRGAAGGPRLPARATWLRRRARGGRGPARRREEARPAAI